MTVLLVLLTFTTFLLIDHFYGSKHVIVPAASPEKGRWTGPRPAPSLAGGFEVRESLRYHPGHTWALSESPSLVRVGMDDFAAKLAGAVQKITLPQRGQWIRQGQKLCTLHRDGAAVDLVSPIEGSVSNVNDVLAETPELANQDPYGEGWLISVHSPDAKTNFKNLLGGALARWWTEESAGRLRAKASGLMPAAALAQDGGVAVDDVASHLPDLKWEALAREFFLS